MVTTLSKQNGHGCGAGTLPKGHVA